MQGVILKIILAAIPTILPALISELVKYLNSVQNNPIRLKEFNDLVRLFVKASQDLPNRSDGAANATAYLEKRYREEQEKIKQGGA